MTIRATEVNRHFYERCGTDSEGGVKAKAYFETVVDCLEARKKLDKADEIMQ